MKFQTPSQCQGLNIHLHFTQFSSHYWDSNPSALTVKLICTVLQAAPLGEIKVGYGNVINIETKTKEDNFGDGQIAANPESNDHRRKIGLLPEAIIGVNLISDQPNLNLDQTNIQGSSYNSVKEKDAIGMSEIFLQRRQYYFDLDKRPQPPKNR